MAAAQFTEEERETMRKGITGAGMLVALSDKSFFDSFKEAGALARHLGEGRKSDNELIRELSEGAGTGFGLTASPDEVERETVDALRSSVSLLQTKSPENVEPYKKLVLDVAQSVADAAGGGEAAEGPAVQKIRSALAAT
jgi:hypothetical protein